MVDNIKALSPVDILKIIVAYTQFWEWVDADFGYELEDFFKSEDCPEFLEDLWFFENEAEALGQKYMVIYADEYYRWHINALAKLKIEGQVSYTESPYAYLVERER